MNKLTQKMSLGKTYVAPEIKTVVMKIEGTLCTSFGTSTPGYMIDDAEEEDWGTL